MWLGETDARPLADSPILGTIMLRSKFLGFPCRRMPVPLATRTRRLPSPAFEAAILDEFWHGRPAPAGCAGAVQQARALELFPTDSEGIARVRAGDSFLEFWSCSRRERQREDTLHVLVEGQQVRHEVYGMGVITESDSERTSVDFEAHGMKKFVTTLWTADIIGEPPSKPPRRKRRSKKAIAAAAAAK
jgi:hypothetical protein